MIAASSSSPSIGSFILTTALSSRPIHHTGAQTPSGSLPIAHVWIILRLFSARTANVAIQLLPQRKGVTIAAGAGLSLARLRPYARRVSKRMKSTERNINSEQLRWSSRVQAPKT
ncbi:hypothetical protein K458DRAFT_116656 [Lentithecium fluviatile CBS 122367]|uniref:Uncharacterized protein n=1 Tax=Lentithecium fluviatile CBS 122367 TaxID=1168545 RepID=A0A6G1IMJ0_9PLEO|nr:hypothetical protein K458DRAFT_116656 [Lentithecium fluviatile CBS 122367]